MSKKRPEKKQHAGRLAIAVIILTALVFMLLGPKAKAHSTGTQFGSPFIHTIHPAQ
jgi:hypothetical protein